MNLLRSFYLGVIALLRKEQRSFGLDAELAADSAAQEKMRRGMSSEDALRAARTNRSASDSASASRWHSSADVTCAVNDTPFAFGVLSRSPPPL